DKDHQNERRSDDGDHAFDTLLTRLRALDVLCHGRATRRAAPARLAHEQGSALGASDLQAERHGSTLSHSTPLEKTRGRRVWTRPPPARSERRRGLAPPRLPRLAAMVGRGRAALTPPCPVLRPLPLPQATSEVVGVDVEHVADVLEREEPGTIGVLDPKL